MFHVKHLRFFCSREGGGRGAGTQKRGGRRRGPAASGKAGKGGEQDRQDEGEKEGRKKKEKKE